MPPTTHSKYSPSGMGDKLLCLGRHLATQGMDNGSSPAADRGTECHDWAEKLFIACIDGTDCPAPEFVEDWQEDTTKEMVAHAYEIYDNLCMFGEVDVHVEAKVDLGWFEIEDGTDLSEVFGTCDVLLYSAALKTLVVLDYKTGVGIEVHPHKNVQMMIYALGAIGMVQGDIEKVKIVVSQPRIYKEAQTWETTPEYLYEWANTVLAPGIKTMSEPGAPFTPGKKQCQWCPIKGKCKAQKTEMLQMFDFEAEKEIATGGDTLNDQDIADLLKRLPDFKAWVGQIEGAAMDILKAGKPLSGYKLVRGKSKRKWVSEEAADKFLKGQKLTEKQRYTRSIIGIPAAEKLLADKLESTTITRNNFTKVVTKPEGKLSWATEDDDREAVVINPVADLTDLDDLL